MAARVIRVFAVLFCGMALACSSGTSTPSTNAPPDSVVKAWLEALDEAAVSDAARAKAVALLAAPARQNLSERAKRTNVLLGVRSQPAEMLAAGMLGLRFRPKRFSTEFGADRSSGERADVVVTGNEGERALFPCVKESEGWRVDVPLPPLPQLLRH